MLYHRFTSKMRVKAFAKINLGLRVLGKRADGFHAIDSLFAEVNFHDILEFEKRKDGKILLACEGEKIPPKENLVWKAAWLLQKFSPQNLGVNIFLKKRIPSGGGLGGGSSDAAATLKALNRLWGLRFSKARLEKLALSLGSDIPFFISGGNQRVKGRGEILQKIDLPKRFPREVVLIIPPIQISTKTAYANAKFKNQAVKLQMGDLTNDFEKSLFVVYPLYRKIKRSLKAAGSCGVALSGSGSVMYGLFTSKTLAKQAVKKLEKLEFGKVIHTTLRK